MSFVTGNVQTSEIAVDSQDNVYFRDGNGAGRYGNGTFVYTDPTVPQGFEFYTSGSSMAVNKLGTAYWDISVMLPYSLQVFGEHEVGATGAPPLVLGSFNAGILDAVAAGNGDVWTLGQDMAGTNNIEIITPDNNVTTVYDVPRATATALGVGSDGSIWASGASYNGSIFQPSIFHFDAAGNVVKTYNLPAFSNELAGDARGNIWVLSGNSVGRLNPKNGDLKFFPIPTANSGVARIVLGPDGNMWFTEENANKIGSISQNGHIAEYSLPSGYVEPDGIAGTPSGCLQAAIWFSVQGALGKITF